LKNASTEAQTDHISNLAITAIPFGQVTNF